MASDPYSQGAAELIGLIGAGMQANSNSHKISDVKALASDWHPDYGAYTDEYFKNLARYQPEASALSDTIGKSEMNSALTLRESALPGIGKATQDAATALFPLLKGELPPEILRAFNTSGAASSVGGGFGGSGFGFLNQGLFGARGALGAMQTGYSMLGSLLSTMPRVGDQLAFRQQQIGIGLSAAGMPSGNDAWANYIEGVAGVNAGQSARGGGMNFGGGGGGSSGGVSGGWGTGGGGSAGGDIWGGGATAFA